MVTNIGATFLNFRLGFIGATTRISVMVNTLPEANPLMAAIASPERFFPVQRIEAFPGTCTLKLFTSKGRLKSKSDPNEAPISARAKLPLGITASDSHQDVPNGLGKSLILYVVFVEIDCPSGKVPLAVIACFPFQV